MINGQRSARRLSWSIVEDIVGGRRDGLNSCSPVARRRSCAPQGYRSSLAPLDSGNPVIGALENFVDGRHRLRRMLVTVHPVLQRPDGRIGEEGQTERRCGPDLEDGASMRVADRHVIDRILAIEREARLQRVR
jgi:hypothetical protein